MNKVKIKGIKDRSRFEDYVASSLVDIAYIEGTIENMVALSVESNIDLNNTKDREWVMELIDVALIECEENSVNISFE